MSQKRKTIRRKTVKPKTQKAGSKHQHSKNEHTRNEHTKHQHLNKSHAEVVSFFMEMLTTIKLYHWKTRSYSQHKATDELHERLQENIDKFVEVMLGKTRGGAERVKMIQKCLHIFDFSKKSDFRDQIIEYREFLMRMSQFLDKERDNDLLNIRDEMVADVNQFLYLLSFDK